MTGEPKSRPEIGKRPKTGGRKKGTPNKRTVWLRDAFERGGVDFEGAIKKAMEEQNVGMLTVLQGFLPYMAPRIKEKDAEAGDDSGDSDPLASLPTADLAALARGIQ